MSARDDVLALRSRMESIVGQEKMIERLLLGLLAKTKTIHRAPSARLAVRQDRTELGFDERVVRRDEGKVVHQRGGYQETVARVGVCEHYLAAANRHLKGQNGFLRRSTGERFRDPSARLIIQLHAAALGQHQKLPDADRRDPDLVLGPGDSRSYALAQPAGLSEAPEPDMRVEQQLQRLIAAQILASTAGPTTSPEISTRPAMAPSQFDREARRCGGITSATGWPKRVINTGRPVRFTRWRTARQVALNFDTGMLSMESTLTWSEIMVKCAPPQSPAASPLRLP